MNPTNSSTPSGADPEFGFKLKAAALCLTALPLALHLYLPPGHPHLDRGSPVPVFYAIAMTILYLRFATWIFFDGLWRRPSWFMPAFWMCVVPGITLAIFLEEKGTVWLHGMVPGLSPPEPSFMDWVEEMRERFEGVPRRVVQQSPYAGFGFATLYYIAVVGLAEEFVKWLCSLTRRGGTQVERVALGFASGLGFGVAEAIQYSGTLYNGESGFLMYLARFVSLVGLHACWTSLTVYFMERRRKSVDRWANLHSILLHLLPTVLLHGLYDVLVTYDLNFLALVMVAGTLGLFLWMLWRMEHGIDWAGRSPVLVSSDPMGWVRTVWAACPPALRHRILQLADQVTAAEPPPLPPAQAGHPSDVFATEATTPPLALPAPEPAAPEGQTVAEAERGEGVVPARPARKRAGPVKRCRSKTPRTQPAIRAGGPPMGPPVELPTSDRQNQTTPSIHPTL
jgi:hypothetical protein